MKTIDEKVREYDEAILKNLDYYNSEYNRLKNRMNDNHPYLLNVKNKIKELKAEIRYLKIK
ncbi:MAG: hypothetical protein FWC39_10630 [Bacteroidetes bacterium]|nr:hypothetical protein [Bacteroidota bacterium]